VPSDIKTEVQAAISELKKAIESGDIDEIKSKSEHAAQVSQKMGTAIYQAAQAAQASEGGASGSDSAAGSSSDDNVVDAEIVDEGEGGAAV